MTTGHARRSLAARLNDDWTRLAANPAARRQVASWPVGDPPRTYDGPDELLAAAGLEGGLPMAAADRVLADVVARAANDALAARIVLQRLVPGLVLAAVRRTAGRPGQRQGLFDELAATAWVVIRTYPLDRRPIKIAVNLLRDAEYHTCVRPVRLRAASEVPVDEPFDLVERHAQVDGRPVERGRSATEEVAEVLDAGVRAGLPADDLGLVRRLYLEGRSTADVAAELGVTPRTVYNRKMAALARLAAVAS